jgi:kinetochore protein Mis13/DSN1
MQAELSTLKTKEIQDAMKLASSVPHMILKPMKPGKAKKAKPPSTAGSSLSTAGNTSSFNTKPPSTTSYSAPAPAANTSARSKPSSSANTSTLSIPKRTKPTQIPDSGSLITQKQKSVAKIKEQTRRSSFGQRGKRVSGSFESGEAVIPHDSVPSEKLYRHIDSDLPEPHRARHLLVWCARRAATDMSSARKPTSKKGKIDDRDSALLATIQDRVVRQLMDLKIDIPLYDLGFGLDAKKGKGEKPLEEDPANIKNRDHKERLTKAEER